MNNHCSWGRGFWVCSGLCGASDSCGNPPGSALARGIRHLSAREGLGPSAGSLCPHSPPAPHRPAKAPPRPSLSVEDVSAPGLARAVGRMVEVFPDGTSQLQLQRSPEGTFGFCVASGNGRRDSGRPAPALFWLHSPGALANHCSAFWLWSFSFPVFG